MSLIDKVKEAKTTRQIGIKVANCIEQVGMGYVGRFQMTHSGRKYCLRSKEYCPLQTDSAKVMNCCDGDSYVRGLYANK